MHLTARPGHPEKQSRSGPSLENSVHLIIALFFTLQLYLSGIDLVIFVLFLPSDIPMGFSVVADKPTPFQGSLVTLRCKASTYVFKGIQWQFVGPHNQTRQQQDNWHIETKPEGFSKQSVLTLSNVTGSDTGYYQCYAQERRGEVKRMEAVYVEVQGKSLLHASQRTNSHLFLFQYLQ